MIKPESQNLGSTSEAKLAPKMPWIEDLSEDDPRRKALTFATDREFKSIYKKWNEHLDALGVDENTKTKYKIGNISEDLAVELHNSFRSIPILDFDKYNCNPDYVASPMKENEVPLWRKFLLFYDFHEEQLALVKLICKELQPTIESFLGTGFRIINTKAFETLPGANYFGPNKAHTDSMYPRHTYKVFTYLTGASEYSGTTRLFGDKSIHVEGPPGVFVLFNPVFTQHCGIPPKEVPRAMLELILVPSEKTEINPTFNGTNSTHPISPWK